MKFFVNFPQRMLGKKGRKNVEFLSRIICIMAGVRPQKPRGKYEVVILCQLRWSYLPLGKSDDLLTWNLPVLLQLHKRWLSWISRRPVHSVFRCVRRIGCIHARLWCARGALVRAPQIREVQRVGAYRGHFFETNFYAAFYTSTVNRTFHYFFFPFSNNLINPQEY